MNNVKASIIIAACNEGQNLVDTVECIIRNTSFAAFEVIVVDDGSTDGSSERVAKKFMSQQLVKVHKTKGIGVAGARNWGARNAEGEIFAFLDGHCYTPSGWMELLMEPLTDPQVGIVGPLFANLSEDTHARGAAVIWRNAGLEMEWLASGDSVLHPVPLLPSGCDVIRRDTFEDIGGYDNGMTRWGSEGQELSLRAWMMGYHVLVQPQAVIHHLFRKQHPYRVEVVDVLYNKLRMALLHLNERRLTKVFEYCINYPGFALSMFKLLESDAMERRREMHRRRCRDDDWFFAHFGLSF